MANNCDYCHKPLSLMRRLRGEQFCSVEHLDAYAAQQAEFALERLAASVTDTPNTARPPLPKPAGRLRPVANREAAQEAPMATGNVAVQEREPELAAAVARTAEPEYPMAPYLDQAEIEPRELEAVEDHKTAFEPVDHWGKATPGWSMPPFRSEPSDPRTWNAGKLIAQIPPVAGLRELPRTKAPETEDGFDGEFTGHTLIRDSGTLEALAFRSEPIWLGITEAACMTYGLENRLESADPIPGRLRTQASSFEWYQVSGAQFQPLPLAQGQVPFSASGMPELQVALPQSAPLRTKPVGTGSSVESETLLTPTAFEVSLPHPGGWTWTQTIEAPKVAMPGFAAARLDAAHAVGAIEAQAVETTLRTPAAHWSATHLGNGGASFGWESARVHSSQHTAVEQADAAFAARLPVALQLQGQMSAGLDWAGPCLASPKHWSFSAELGTASDVIAAWALRIPVQSTMDLRRRLAPPRTGAMRSTVRLLEPPTAIPAVRTEVRQAGPVKYSPVAIVVVPAPQFALLPAAMTDEQRYVAQVPNGVWRLPRVRHTGYRALGPFPKLPPRVPDKYLRPIGPEMAPAAEDLRVRAAGTAQDLSSVPKFASPDAVRIHPADYLVWPQPKALKLAKILPERVAQQEAPAPPIKRFGPGRAGLQARNRNADGLARA